jgi:hypothetical protein
VVKQHLILVVLLVSLSMLTACGSDGSVLGVPQSSAQELNSSNGQNTEELSRGFELSTDFTTESIQDNKEITIPAGTQLVVLENAIVDGKELVRVGLEYPSDSVLPQDLWVAGAELAKADLRAIHDVDPYDENGEEITFGEFARAKMTYCYRYVKQYLLSHGMVNVYLPGGSAWMAAAELPKHGFKKSNRRAASAIINDVCVYKGGPSGHGHIEILTSKGWYYGYGYKSHPIQNRIFMGCFHK